MLTYVLESRTVDSVVFLFFPDGNKRPGRIRFTNDGEFVSIEDSKDDFKRFYGCHAIHGIDVAKDEGVVAWY